MFLQCFFDKFNKVLVQDFRKLKSCKMSTGLVISIVDDVLESLLSQKVELMLDFVSEMGASDWRFNCNAIHWISFRH